MFGIPDGFKAAVLTGYRKFIRSYRIVRRKHCHTKLHSILLVLESVVLSFADDATVVTQEFHLPRALMLCRGLGIDAAGVTADDQRPWGYSRRSLTYSQIREFPATAVAVLDVLRRQEPPVMGEPIPILQGRGLD